MLNIKTNGSVMEPFVCCIVRFLVKIIVIQTFKILRVVAAF